MSSLRVLRLCHLVIPVVAAFPCVDIAMGARVDSWNIYGILLRAGADMNARAWLPYLTFAATTVIGARLGLRPAAPPTVRVVAISAAIAGLAALVDLGSVAFVHAERPGFLFVPSMRVEARFGLYSLLVLQAVALALAWRLPRDSTPAAASSHAPKS